MFDSFPVHTGNTHVGVVVVPERQITTKKTTTRIQQSVQNKNKNYLKFLSYGALSLSVLHCMKYAKSINSNIIDKRWIYFFK